MKNSIVLAVFFLVFVSGTGWAQPRLEMDSPSYVAPEPVGEGREALGTFHVRNTGTETLTVEKVTPGCGCLVSYFDASIPPGEQGRIELKLDTRGLRGRVKKRALVVTNDPESARVLIEMTVVVR